MTIYARAKDANWAESPCLSSVWTWDNTAPPANNISNSADEWSNVLLTASVSDLWTTTHAYQRYSDSTCDTQIASEVNSTYTALIQNEPINIDYYYKTFDAQW
jgi:hypothetical protein